MDYGKIDSALAMALNAGRTNQPEINWEVFVRTAGPVDSSQQNRLEELGVRGVEPGRTVFTARLSRQGIDCLSELPWIRLISLAQSLRPLQR